MSDKSKFDELMHWLLSFKPIAMMAFSATIFLAVIGFIKTVSEVRDYVVQKQKDQRISDSLKVVKDSLEYERVTSPTLTLGDTIRINGKLDLYNFIKNIVPNANYSEGTVTPWEAEGDNEAITWVTAGFESNPDEDKYANNDTTSVFTTICDSPYYREGYCVLTNRGRYLYSYLSVRNIPGRWRISYCGPRAGVFNIYIESLDDSDYLGSAVIEEVFKKRAKLKIIQGKVDHDEGFASPSDILVYDIKIPNKQTIRITEMTDFNKDINAYSKTFEITTMY